MKRKIAPVVALAMLCAASLTAHDLFLKPVDFFVATHSDVRIRVLNGTFTSSENAVTADRLRDLRVISPGGTSRPDSGAWKALGDTSILTLTTGGEGTYLIGASLLPRVLGLEAAQFNRYLASDGLPDVLAARRRSGELGRPARERYSKHVKTLVQVGSARSGDFSTVMDHPAELIPLDNPYTLGPGATLRVRALVDGAPVARQVVLSGGRTARGARIAERSTRTDRDGLATITLSTRGQWYIKFIRMERVAGDSVDYESKWATLTFAIQ